MPFDATGVEVFAESQLRRVGLAKKLLPPPGIVPGYALYVCHPNPRLATKSFSTDYNEKPVAIFTSANRLKFEIAKMYTDFSVVAYSVTGELNISQLQEQSGLHTRIV